ncbi:hypothetical protein NP493_312g05002 [Ridgeia piscesae]|uniref:Uncharacterized protein n=1 Tax=Ridgeia piscesae TaxID=27915 RepID=A0AAD9NW28_RIDPI|nr:hypothetical protein NP493_312g05002 [Ridgeia piscesae]
MSRIFELGLTPAFISPLPMKHEGRFMVAIVPAIQTLKRFVYIDEKYKGNMATYRRYVVEVMTAFGASADTVDADVKDMIDFEVKVANLIDWGKYINTVYSVVNVSVNSTEKILVEYINYFRQIGTLIYTTPLRTVVNYMIWTAVSGHVHLLSHPFIQAYRKLNKEFGVTTAPLDQWKSCLEVVKYHMPVACSRIFVQDYFDDTARSDTEEMFATLHQTFTQMLAEVTWMGADMKRKAQEKADAMVDNIGYPRWILNNTLLNAYYEMVHIDRNQYFNNVNHLTLTTRRAIMTVVNTQDTLKSITWMSSPVTVNAFYYHQTNRIEFPAAMLQPPFYHKDYPKSLNYGKIGYFIGHEITHGFDNSGRLYNKDGEKENWWTACSTEKFQRRAQCMVDQYDGYISPQLGTPVNGTKTLGENIADNGGVKQSFRAYQTWRQTSRKAELSLPGVDLDSNQLFFVGFAQLWCLKGTSYFYKTMAKDVHSPERFRVIGTLSNSEDFAKAYSCPVGSPMNPVKKCAVW